MLHSGMMMMMCIELSLQIKSLKVKQCRFICASRLTIPDYDYVTENSSICLILFSLSLSLLQFCLCCVFFFSLIKCVRLLLWKCFRLYAIIQSNLIRLTTETTNYKYLLHTRMLAYYRAVAVIVATLSFLLLLFFFLKCK